MRPKVTIAVAVFNVGIYIEQCARSLFEQTLDDLEIIFVNDASTDDSVAIIEQTLQEYPNRKEQVQILNHEHNMGLPQTRKDAFEIAQGEYIIFNDGDDWVEPRYAELLYSKAQETGAEIVVCDFNFQYFTRNYPEDYQMWTNPMFMAPEGEGHNGDKLRDETLNQFNAPNMWARLLQTDFFRQTPIMWPPKGMAEDLVLSTQATFYANKLAHVAEHLYNYRVIDNSISHNKEEGHVAKIFNDFMENYQIYIEFMRRENLDKKYENGIFITKITLRNLLLPLINKPKYWWKFFTTFPELNWLFLVGNKKHKPSWRERAWLLSIFFGLYPRFNKKINKHFRPRKGWIVN